jgi:hypothetical protein
MLFHMDCIVIYRHAYVTLVEEYAVSGISGYVVVRNYIGEQPSGASAVSA